MRLVRFAWKHTPRIGELAEETVYGLRRVHGGSWSVSNLFRDGSSYPLARVRLLAPAAPSKIICVGANYRKHAKELGHSVPKVPLIFLKPPSAIIGPGDNIVLPPDSRQVDYEGELAVVISRKASRIKAKAAAGHILGYTCFNDVTERVVQKEDGQWTRAKGYDTFAPFGPWIETDVDPGDLAVETFVNGERRQSGRTGDMVFPVPQLVSFISHVMTLLPGDVIATGTPPGIGPLKSGDVVEVCIEGIGTLRNPVISSRLTSATGLGGAP